MTKPCQCHVPCEGPSNRLGTTFNEPTRTGDLRASCAVKGGGDPRGCSASGGREMRRSSRRKLLCGAVAVGLVFVLGSSSRRRAGSDAPWEDEEEYAEEGDISARAAPRAARNELPDEVPLPAGLGKAEMAAALRAQRLARLARGKETAETAKLRAAQDTARQYAEEAQGNPDAPVAVAGLATTLHPAYNDMLKE